MLQRLALRGTPKATKQAARYTPAGGAERCGMCRHFAPSSSCARIEGPVSAAGWCQLYSQQATWRPRAGQAAGGGSPAGLTLDMSFMTPGALPAGLTFTRASTATYFDATGTMQSATANTPRWDYSPSALTLNGLLIEEARTNGVRNGAAAGAIPGTPGTPPTNWTIGGAGIGLTAAIIGTGVESGIPYVDVRYTGTASAAGAFNVTCESNTAIVAANGQVMSNSIYWRVVGGTTNGVTGGQIFIRELTSAGALVRDNVIAATAPTTAGLATQRVTASATLIGGGTTARVNGIYGVVVSNGAVVDITVRFGAPQTEQGAGATSCIPTAGAAVTRAADACGAATGAWFSASASSLAADFMVGQTPNPSAANSRSPAGLSDGTTNNRIRLYGQGSNSANAVLGTTVAGSGANSASLGNPSANAVAKIAGAWNGTTAVGSLNGGAAVSQSIGIPSGLTSLTIGTEFAGSTSYLNGWVQRVRYWNRALSTAELQSVTT